MIRVAAIKLGGRIAINTKSTTGGVNEIATILQLMANNGFKVTAYTKILGNDAKIEGIEIKDILTTDVEKVSIDNDVLLVFNGNANFFGGAEDTLSLTNYKYINRFSGKVIYALTDLNLILSDIWKSVSSKPWGDKYSEEEIKIQRKDICVLSQAMNTNKIKTLFSNKGIYTDNVIYMPWDEFPAFSLHDIDIEKSTDLIYGGTFRSGKRESDMIKFYFGYPDDISVEMFGKIEHKDFKKNKNNYKLPNFTKALPYNEYIMKTASGRATIIIADPIYKETRMKTTRFYESIRAGDITFIDKSYDSLENPFYKIDELKSLCIVNDREDVIDKLRKLKNDASYTKNIIELQRNSISHIDKSRYCTLLINGIETCLNS